MPCLAATYTSPAHSAAPHTLSAALPALAPQPATHERIAYLDKLQSALRAVQADVNTFLTQKMQEDKAAGDSKGDDAKDEETYGEEVVEED